MWGLQNFQVSQKSVKSLCGGRKKVSLESYQNTRWNFLLYCEYGGMSDRQCWGDMELTHEFEPQAQIYLCALV